MAWPCVRNDVVVIVHVSAPSAPGRSRTITSAALGNRPGWRTRRGRPPPRRGNQRRAVWAIGTDMSGTGGSGADAGRALPGSASIRTTGRRATGDGATGRRERRGDGSDQEYRWCAIATGLQRLPWSADQSRPGTRPRVGVDGVGDRLIDAAASRPGMTGSGTTRPFRHGETQVTGVSAFRVCARTGCPGDRRAPARSRRTRRTRRRSSHPAPLGTDEHLGVRGHGQRAAPPRHGRERGRLPARAGFAPPPESARSLTSSALFELRYRAP
jgi:hypothetical protein